MESATITDRTLEIDGMTGEACVTKVKAALKGVRGVETQSVKVGSANIGADEAGCQAACAAIATAGYKAREGVRADSADPTSRSQPGSTAPRTGGPSNGPANAPAQRSLGDNATTPNSGAGAKPAERPMGNPQSKGGGRTN